MSVGAMLEYASAILAEAPESGACVFINCSREEGKCNKDTIGETMHSSIESEQNKNRKKTKKPSTGRRRGPESQAHFCF